jgi:hypothetical protein
MRLCSEAVTEHPAINIIIYLGSHEQVENNFQSSPIPMMLQWQGFRCLGRSHAYSIDPFIARRLLSTVFESGMNTKHRCFYEG